MPCNSKSPVACPLCQKMISRKSDLPRHIETHFKRGMNDCPHPLCGHSTRQLSNLKVHYLARHTDLPPYPCQSCGMGFRKPPLRVAHRIKQHGFVPIARNRPSASHTHTSSSSTAGSKRSLAFLVIGGMAAINSKEGHRHPSPGPLKAARRAYRRRRS